MNPDHVAKVFEFIVFLFAISFHESAHAWMANRCGDPTARMLGRITLNPIKHIDPIGTLLFPIVGLYQGGGVFGWAKPTPVDPRNFKNEIKDDILTSVVGPVSNFLLAFVGTALLLALSGTSQIGNFLVRSLAAHSFGLAAAMTTSILVPVTLFLYEFVFINVMLAVFNLIPVPPLDGSHVLRHFLPDSMRRAYDQVGLFALLALVFLGGGLLSRLITPFLDFFDRMLTLL